MTQVTGMFTLDSVLGCIRFRMSVFISFIAEKPLSHSAELAGIQSTRSTRARMFGHFHIANCPNKFAAGNIIDVRLAKVNTFDGIQFCQPLKITEWPIMFGNSMSISKELRILVKSCFVHFFESPSRLWFSNVPAVLQMFISQDMTRTFVMVDKVAMANISRTVFHEQAGWIFSKHAPVRKPGCC